MCLWQGLGRIALQFVQTLTVLFNRDPIASREADKGINRLYAKYILTYAMNADLCDSTCWSLDPVRCCEMLLDLCLKYDTFVCMRVRVTK